MSTHWVLVTLMIAGKTLVVGAAYIALECGGFLTGCAARGERAV